MKNKFFRTLAVTLAAVLCFTAFSTTAFAGGADPDPAPLPEETGTPTTGGIELDTEDAEGGNDTSSTTEDTESTDTEESTGAAETMTDEEMAALLSSLLGSQVDVTVTDEGIQLSNKDDGTPNQTGTVVTNGGNLNVRTGAGTDNQAFTQLPNGTQVEVIGTEDNGWVKILLPEREGYVCGDYLTVSDAATGDGVFSLRGIVFNHLFRSPLLACDGGLDRGAVQQHFLFGHPVHSCLFYACISITQKREKYQRRKHFPTHLEALSGGDWIICPACPPTVAGKP